MKNIWNIVRNDFRRISTNVVAIVIVIGLCILPSLYAWFNIASNWNPYGENATSRLKIAVFSGDQGMSSGQLSLCIGDSIVSALENNETVGWVFPKDERAAINGVYSGEYYAALIIPGDFTASIAGILSGDLSGGTITYYGNEKKNAIASIITSKAKTAVETQINRTVFTTLSNIVCEIGNALQGMEKEGSIQFAIITELEKLEKDIQRHITSLDTLMHTANTTRSSIKSLNSLSEKMLSDLVEDFSLLSTSPLQLPKLQTANVRLADYAAALKKGSNSFKSSKKLLMDLQDTINTIKTELTDTKDSKEFQELVAVLEEQPEKASAYFASLVDLDKKHVYEIKNYGSSMAPFYTVLSVWVGALILAAILHTKVRQPFEEEPYRVYEAFFGRYVIFFLIGQMQTLICVLGNLFFMEIQCPHPFLFWFASAICSFVFTLLIYSLVFILGNIGEAAAVVIMVVQVAGTGGTFPMEVLPAIYQKLYQFLPFSYGMTALRECVGGMYRYDYWIALLELLPFAAVSLILGLFLKNPLRGLNERIEQGKEKSDLMV